MGDNTAKAKAKDLIDKFSVYFPLMLHKEKINPAAKQCALIAVDEILKAYEYFDEKVIKRKEEYRPLSEYDFWQQVKEEIKINKP